MTPKSRIIHFFSINTVCALGLTVLAVFAVHSTHGCATQETNRVKTTQTSLQSPSTDKPQDAPQEQDFIKSNFTKRDVRIPMRDGVKLFTSIYEPKDKSQTYPIMMIRTPYSVRPYGEDKYRSSLGPSSHFQEEGYIFVYQDVRGKYLSEGEFVNMRPHLENKQHPNEIDESSDTFDTIDWLIENIPNNNAKVGMWGISYPGFYVAAGMIDAHPALKAVSPQAPIADWFFDDFHHHGAFFLPHGFRFISSFGQPRPEPTTSPKGRSFEFDTPDGYQFYLDMGPLKNANEKYLHGEIEYWDKMTQHPNYDEFWQAQNILPHLNNVPPAVLTVGGWFDAEDLYGPLKIYKETERNNPTSANSIVMGPWRHGGWNRVDGDHLGNIDFGGKQSQYFQEKIQLPFFNYHLKGKGELDLPEAYVFETGTNKWCVYDNWPPQNTVTKYLYMNDKLSLSFNAPQGRNGFDEYISDPDKPVPFTQDINGGMTRNYMTDDQRFAARRPDVLAYQTKVLEEDITLAGPMLADLWVSTSGSSGDWIVKLIDVFPGDAKDSEFTQQGMRMGGYQMMVRSEVIRGRFRNSYEHPEPFTPNEPTNIKLELLDVLHTFKKGHRIMVQIQSTWFPLVDRNPQNYVDNIFMADESDFTKATIRIYRSEKHPTRLRIGVLEKPILPF